MSSMAITITADNAPETLGGRLAQSRKWVGLSQTAMADQLDCSKRSIANYEADAREPGYFTVVKWARITGFETKYFEDVVNSDDGRFKDYSRVCRGQLSLLPMKRADVLIDLTGPDHQAKILPFDRSAREESRSAVSR